MKEWIKNKMKKMTIVHELHKLVSDKNIFVNAKVNEAQWKAFKEEYNFTSASMTTLIREVGEDFLRSKLIKSGKNREVSKYTACAFSNFIKK